MRRKTFVKQIMSLGVSRNEIDRICRDKLFWKPRFSYENAFAWVCFYYSCGMHISGRPLTVMERQKFSAWRGKRAKPYPLL